jgi:pimeloyl-ACP methyl ester carboxylesterase
VLEWKRCGGDFECTTLPVPVDYVDAAAGELELAVSRRPADDPDRRIGSLVVNYGGPGDPGSETLRYAADSVPAAVRRRFDLVSFDPRGTGSSRPVDCVDDETFERAWSQDPTPDGTDQLPAFYDGTAFDVDLVAECVARNGTWLARVGTRNVARDLDRLRAALGDTELSYLGYSYGTVLGAAYAQEFPDHVRTMVLDSAVDLSASTEAQLRDNLVGFERALEEFLDDCAARDDCAFHGGTTPRDALDTLRAELEDGERLQGADDRAVGPAEFYVALLAALYSRNHWSFLADALDRATSGDGSGLQILSDVYAGRRDDGSYSNLQEAIHIIVCADQPEPLVSFEQFRASYEELSAIAPFFGPVIASGPNGCDPRLPAARPEEILGDVRVADTPPIVIIGTTRDPATPYAGAEDLHARIAGSRLVTVNDTSHGSYATGNACVDRIVDRYLLARRAPTNGARCSGA